MPFLIGMSIMAVAFLSVVLTMREARVESISTMIVVKVLGLVLLFYVILGGAYETLIWLSK